MVSALSGVPWHDQQIDGEVQPGMISVLSGADWRWCVVGLLTGLLVQVLAGIRWAALATVVTGLLLAMFNGYIVDALTLSGAGQSKLIGIGMWLGLIMAYNVWMIIWPNQKIALGMVEADADAKKKAARTAMITSRFNTMFSIPMLYFMVAAQNLSGG